MYKYKNGNKPRIFLSSTFEDFAKLRDDLLRIAHSARLNIEAMEFFGAQVNDPLEVCLSKLETCDIYLGIIGKRYGSIHKKSRKSFTQLEYQRAKWLYGRKRMKDIWIFLPSPECKFANKDIDTETPKINKLKKFIQIVHKHTVDHYDNPDDLKSRILLQCLNERTRAMDDEVSEEKKEYSYDAEEQRAYNDYLDSNYESVLIEGLELLPSIVLKTVDEEAYRQGFLDWQESQEDAKEQG